MDNYLALVMLVIGFQWCQSQSPVRPNPPETFQSNLTISFAGGFMKGGLSRDYASMRGIEFSSVDGGAKAYGADLQRFDLGVDYNVFSVGPFQTCSDMNVTGSKFPLLWGWLPMASYMTSGRFELGSSIVDVDAWALNVNGMFFEIAVMSSDPNQVVYLLLVTPQGPGPVMYTFIDWSTKTPTETMFTVPRACSQGQGGHYQQTLAMAPYNLFLTQSITKMTLLFD